MTNDADIVPDPDPANLERLADALRAIGSRLRTESDPEGVPFDPHPALLAAMTVVNLTTRCGDLDVAFRPSGFDDIHELFAAAQQFDLAGGPVLVASLADIIRSKEAAGRPKDDAVLPVLRALAEETDRQS